MRQAIPAILVTLILFSITPLKAQSGDDRVGETAPSTDHLQTESIRLTFERGSTLRGLLEQANLRDGEVDAIIVELNRYIAPNKYRVGQHFDLDIISEKENRRLLQLTFEKSSLRTVVIKRDEEYLSSQLLKGPTFTERRLLVFKVKDSIWQMAGIHGVPASVRSEMLNILSYGLDLQREVQPNDRFEIIYDITVTENGQVVDGGAVQYVALIQKNRVTGFYRFQYPGYDVDYYDAKGRSFKKLFLKTPIASDEILETVDDNIGINFVAPLGTDVYAAGSGRVVQAANLPSFGNYVRIKHRSGYETAYAHLESFAEGVQDGASVSKGQVIGYVGTSGHKKPAIVRPHLQYEVLSNGKQIDPTGSNLPSGRELKGRALKAFKQMVSAIEKVRPGVGTGWTRAKLELNTFASIEAQNFDDQLTALYEGNFSTALDLWLPLAEAGDADAQYGVGIIYDFGLAGMKRDVAEAMHWYKMAAKRGNMDAQFYLGDMYSGGPNYSEHIPIDETEARRWYKMAAEQGHVLAQYVVGAYYFDGTGGIQDYNEAAHWYRKAAVQGFNRSQYHLGVMYGLGLGVSQSYPMAAFWYQKAAHQEFPDAQLKLGLMYFQGLGVSKNHRKAVYWYRKAARQGIARAQYDLGLMYSQGQGVIQHLETAYMWLSLADLRGVNDASRNLEIVAQKMTQEEITEARRRTTKCLESGYKHCL